MLGATTHVDMTSRLQHIDHRCNPLFAQLLRSFQRITSLPILLNTSFNDRDEPIVCSPADAIVTANRTQLDALVLGPFLLTRFDTIRDAHRNPVQQASVPMARLKLSVQILLMLGIAWNMLAAVWFWTFTGIAMVLAVRLLGSHERAERVLLWQHRLTFPIRWLFSSMAFAIVFLAMVCPLGFILRAAAKTYGHDLDGDRLSIPIHSAGPES